MDPGSIMSLAGGFVLVVAIAVVLFVAVVLAVVFVALRKSGVVGQVDKAMAAGSPSPRQLEVERTGHLGRALILDVNELESVAQNRTMIYHRAALVLEVRPPGYPPYRVACEQWFISSKWFHISANTMVPVRVDPRDARIVFVDVVAMDQEKAADEAAKRQEHARRQAELLGRR